MATAKKESRRSRRVRVKIPVSYKLDDSVRSMVSIGADTVQAETVNVSVLGISIHSPFLLPPGIRIRVELDRKPFLAEGDNEKTEPIRALGKIVGIRSAKDKIRLSVMFSEIAPEDKALIAAYVKRNL